MFCHLILELYLCHEINYKGEGKMKKISAIILAIILTMSLVSCVVPSDGEVNETSDVSTGNNSAEEQQDEQAEIPGKEEATIDEMVLVDEAGVKITAKSLEFDGMFGPGINLLIENNSGKDLTFQCRNASVNGYMVDTIMSVDVVNGKKANDSLTFMESDFEACGIKAIADMEIAFHIFDMAEWETYLDTDAIRIETSIADTFEYTYDDSGDIVFEAVRQGLPHGVDRPQHLVTVLDRVHDDADGVQIVYLFKRFALLHLAPNAVIMLGTPVYLRFYAQLF